LKIYSTTTNAISVNDSICTQGTLTMPLPVTLWKGFGYLCRLPTTLRLARTQPKYVETTVCSCF